MRFAFILYLTPSRELSTIEHMSKSTISTLQLFEMFPDQETARLYLEGRLWPTGVSCPTCSGQERITVRKGGYYRCNQCKLDFTVRTGTIFERSHVPLHKWIYAMYLLVTSRKGISSMQLAKEIGVTQKTAWFMLGRLREACGNDTTMLQGIIEVDECYIGGKESNRHDSKRRNLGNGTAGKTTVMGMRERGGRTKAMIVPNSKSSTLTGVILNNVSAGSEIQSDEHAGYYRIEDHYYHEVVNHKAGEYARPGHHQRYRERVGRPEARTAWCLPPRQCQAPWPLCG